MMPETKFGVMGEREQMLIQARVEFQGNRGKIENDSTLPEFDGSSAEAWVTLSVTIRMGMCIIL